MIKSLIRTLRGPSQDPVMAHISRPLPRGLLDEQVVAAVRKALEADPRPNSLVETLPRALRAVTGRDYQVLDRSVRDVTGAYTKVSVMIRDGDVGIWPGHAARAYPLLEPSEKAERTRAAIASADGSGATDEPSPTNPVGKPGWAPPPPRSDAPPSSDAPPPSDPPAASPVAETEEPA
jgi:hypothetical protein